MISLLERFEDKYMPEPMSGCWLWIGSITGNGYGQIWENGKHTLAHRASYKLHKSKIPDGMLVLHKCDNPTCVNPDHLFLGTHKENTSDMFKKGRANPPSGESHWGSKLSLDDVKKIKAALKTKASSQKELATQFNVTAPCISRISRGLTWVGVQ